MTDLSRTTLKSTRNAFRIIQFIEKSDGASITEIANSVTLSKSSVYKYAKTLEEERYLVKTEDNQYHLGLRFLSPGLKARRRKEIYEISKPQIKELAQKSNETAGLIVEEHGLGIFLNRYNSREVADPDIPAGQEVYLHTTALGMAVLAYLPASRVDEIIEQHGLPRMTENTITDREALFGELEEITDRGWAYENGQRLTGLSCIATAILGPDKEPLGAIGISGPSSRMNRSYLTQDLLELIRQAKSAIELPMTYS